MARIPRSATPIGWFHVMNRGVRRTEIFRDDHDRRCFLEDLGSATSACDTKVVGHCQMDNHFHLLLICAQGGLSETMHRLKTRYVRRYNARHGFDGPLFRSRFVSIPIADDAQALVASRYIHRNPLELGYRIDDYPWSSYPDYLGAREAGSIDPEPILQLAGGRDRYRIFVETPIPSDRFAISDGVRSCAPTSRGADMKRVMALVREFAPPGATSRQLRAAALLIAVDLLQLDRAVAGPELGFRTVGALRTAASRARQQLSDDGELSTLVRRVGTQLLL